MNEFWFLYIVAGILVIYNIATWFKPEFSNITKRKIRQTLYVLSFVFFRYIYKQY